MGSFHSAPPNEAIVKAQCDGTRIVVGSTTFVLWCCHSIGRLSLEIRTITIKSEQAETAKGVRVQVKSVAQVKVKARKSDGSLDVAGIKLAAQHFLGDDDRAINESLQRTLEGHQRQILGTLTVEELYRDRIAFSDKISQHVVADLAALGFELASYTVAKIDDENGYMESLGVTQTSLVKRQAAEGKAKNDSARQTRVAMENSAAEKGEAEKAREAHIAVNKTKAEEAKSFRDLQIKQAAFEKEVNQANAVAAAAGPIESAKQRQAIVREQTRQQLVQAEVELKVADQVVERTKREREGQALAKFLEQENEAKAIEVAAAAEADKLRAIGEAEAEVIRLKGEAEAKVLEERAVAYKEYGEAAVVQMIVEQLPSIASSISKPLEKTDKMIFVSGSGGETGAGVLGGLTSMMGQLPAAVEGLVGVDLREAAKKYVDADETKKRGEAVL